MFLETQATNLLPCFFLGFGEFCRSSLSYFYCFARFTVSIWSFLLRLELQAVAG